jgi:hypothetical protein
MQQFNMPFIQMLNKFQIAAQNRMNIKCINSICYQQPNFFTISYLFYINLSLCKIKNENVVTNTLDPTFNFENN